MGAVRPDSPLVYTQRVAEADDAQPNSNFHLWTPVGSSGPHPHHYSAISPTPYAGPPQPEILSPVPLQMPAKPPPIGESSSPDTTTGDDDKGGRMGFFQAKAAESMRYIAYREETQKEKDEKELRAELKGKRVWKVGGIGMMAYSLDPALEKKKKRIWSKESGKEEEWVHAARTRTKLYTDSRGVKPLVMWKLVENGPVPRDAMPLGSEEDGALLFAARAWREGGLHLGK